MFAGALHIGFISCITLSECFVQKRKTVSDLGASDIHIHVRSAYYVRYKMHDLPIVE
jgi:hypothetical protein